MEPLETFFRERNIRLFLIVGRLPTVRASAKVAGLNPQHATRLVRIWRRKGWIVREGSMHGFMYHYTAEGEKILAMTEVLNDKLSMV